MNLLNHTVELYIQWLGLWFSHGWSVKKQPAMELMCCILPCWYTYRHFGCCSWSITGLISQLTTFKITAHLWAVWRSVWDTYWASLHFFALYKCSMRHSKPGMRQIWTLTLFTDICLWRCLLFYLSDCVFVSFSLLCCSCRTDPNLKEIIWLKKGYLISNSLISSNPYQWPLCTMPGP